jgi:hypothetical protein
LEIPPGTHQTLEALWLDRVPFQLPKNDGCANVLVETKTSHFFEAIVYFRHYVIGVHK